MPKPFQHMFRLLAVPIAIPSRPQFGVGTSLASQFATPADSTLGSTASTAQSIFVTMSSGSVCEKVTGSWKLPRSHLKILLRLTKMNYSTTNLRDICLLTNFMHKQPDITKSTWNIHSRVRYKKSNLCLKTEPEVLTWVSYWPL